MIGVPDKYICEVVKKEKLADNVFIVTAANVELAAAAGPGQFLHVKCGEARMLRRPISVCCVRGSCFRFAFEVKGEGTQWLSKCEPGQALDILGPLGNGFAFPEGKIIVIGGGIGVPPMLCAAESAIGEVTAVIGFRNKDRIMLMDGFAAVCDEVYVATDDGSFGSYGPVTMPLIKLLEGGGYSAVMACGPHAMLSAVTVLCKLYGVPCQVSLEERMACGVGACLVCACATVSDGIQGMSRVCKDGPVFESGKVVL